jgi:hypothetical protein
MRLTCSCCGAHGSIEFFSTDTNARRFNELVSKLPAPLVPIAQKYAALFRPLKTKGLTWDRACDIVSGLQAMCTAGGVDYYGKHYPASPELLASVIHQMLDNRDGLTLPLKTHAYLIKVAVAKSGAEVAQIEKLADQQRLSGSRNRGAHQGGDASAVGDLLERLPVRRMKTGPDGIELAPGQRPDETQAEFFIRRQREG